jgi:hypothetical protein
MMIPRLAVFAEASLLLASAQQFIDRFNYDATTPNVAAGFTNYGPSNWGGEDIECDEFNQLDEC